MDRTTAAKSATTAGDVATAARSVFAAFSLKISRMRVGAGVAA